MNGQKIRPLVKYNVSSTNIWCKLCWTSRWIISSLLVSLPMHELCLSIWHRWIRLRQTVVTSVLILLLTLTESSLAAPRIVVRGNTRRCRRRPGGHVILLMMQRKFCFFLKGYGFLWRCHIDILSGLSISLPRCHVLCYFTVLFTHTCDIFFVCYMYIWFY